MDNGAGAGPNGSIHAQATRTPVTALGFSKFPIPGTVAQRWYIGPERLS
jgi:hypothetical protein